MSWNSKGKKVPVTDGFAGKTILVLGGSYGIGGALVKQLMPHACTVVVVARSARAFCQEHQAKSKARLLPLAFDLGQLTEQEALLESLQKQNLEADYLVLNLGKSLRRSVLNEEKRWKDWQLCYRLNLESAMKVMDQQLPHLLAKQGQIVHCSSMNVLLPPLAKWGHYHATKSALAIWLRSARQEWAGKGLTVSLAYFPLVRTPAVQAGGLYDKQWAYSEEWAGCKLYRLMRKGKGDYRPWWGYLAQPLATLFSPVFQLFGNRFHP